MELDDELLDRTQADFFLGMPRGFLATAKRSGEGPPYYRMSRNYVRYKKSELTAWMNSRKMTPARPQ